MRLRFIFAVIFYLPVAASLCDAAESVCLKSGFCVQADSHFKQAAHLTVRIGGGSMEFEQTDVVSIAPIGVPEASPTKPPPARAQAAALDASALLRDAAATQGIDADFVRSVAKVESNFKHQAVSKKGAIGLMQIMPATARALAVNASEPGENAMGGAKYLRALLVRYHYNSALALAAYNAGPGTVARFGGVPPYEETRQYVVRVTREYDRLRAANKIAAKSEAANTPNAKD